MLARAIYQYPKNKKVRGKPAIKITINLRGIPHKLLEQTALNILSTEEL